MFTERIKSLPTLLLFAVVIMFFACENPAADNDQPPYKGLAEVKELVLSVELGQTEGTLLWAPPDAAGFTAVVISSDPPAGSLIEPRIIEKATTDFAISGLEYGADYAVTVKALYTEGGLSAGLTENTGTILKLTTSLNELTDELIAMPQNTAANPYLIGPAWISGTTDYNKLLDGLEEAGRYVDLNLSASPMEPVLNPVPFSEKGKKYVVAVTLPESVKRLGYAHDMGITEHNGYALAPTDFPGVFNAAFTYGHFGDKLVEYPHGYYSLKSVNMPGVIEIGDNAFIHCRALEMVSAPLVEVVAYCAFDFCASLKEISLPSAKSIGKVINLATKEITYACGFQFCEKLENVDFPKAELIGQSAFSSCTALESISLPEAVDIGRQAFANCSKLTGVDLPKAVTVGDGAFIYCGALKTITLPNAKIIGGYAFYQCTSLESVTLPSVTGLSSKYYGPLTSENHHFDGTYSLKSITFGQTIPVDGGPGYASFKDAGSKSGGFTIYVSTPEAKSTLEGYLADKNSPWYVAIVAESYQPMGQNNKFPKSKAPLKSVEVY
jgi:hypothetical protein